MLRRRSSMTFVALWLLVMGVVACGSPLRTAACGLNTYGTAIQEQLTALLALDPALVAQAGTPENAAAGDALDAMDQAAADGQEALDAASEDDRPGQRSHPDVVPERAGPDDRGEHRAPIGHRLRRSSDRYRCDGGRSVRLGCHRNIPDGDR